MKFAAIMNIIDPNIGGIMVMGDRGTGKSTTVRALVRVFLHVSSSTDISVIFFFFFFLLLFFSCS